jgi:hypothetical protein
MPAPAIFVFGDQRRGVRSRSGPKLLFGYLNGGAIGAPAKHAILVLTHLRHGVRKPDTAINDETQHSESKKIVHHPVAIIVVLSARILAEVFNGRPPSILPPQIVVSRTRDPRPEENDAASLLVWSVLLRLHVGPVGGTPAVATSSRAAL